ncbi:MAG: hypothetical protein ACON4R_00025 [Akkermansiaceae bacterium]
MKLRKYLLIPVLILPFVWADEGGHKHDQDKPHAHEHEIKPPNGGRILHEVEPHVEFFITKDRKVQLTFVNDHGKPVAGGNASIKAVGGKRSAPTNFTFEKTKTGFISKEKLPQGDLVPIVLMFKDGKGKAVKPIRFNVDMKDCPTCDFLEYACVCDHDHGHSHDHDHKKDKK